MNAPIQRALISVSDKTGIEEFARGLENAGVEILSTGGTFAALKAAGVAVREVSDYTDFPEMMNGRVKTLHPKIHGGILALRDEAAHTASMDDHGIKAIDLVAVNLYPFEETVAREGVSRGEAVEQIDIGGPSMVRSAAKNHRFVTIVTEPGDYSRVLDDLEQHGGATTPELRRELAAKAFALTARYDTAIGAWLFERELEEDRTPSGFPESFAMAGTKVMDLRYGENPHQAAAFYRLGGRQEPSVANSEVLSGKALSYNNLVDLDAALALAKEFSAPFACVIKHTNPCGAALADEDDDICVALTEAWKGDPVSAFGSVLAFTRPLTLAAAEFLVSGNRFVEAIIAPSFNKDALELLTHKPKWGRSVRLLACGPLQAERDGRDVEVKKLVGGFLLQDRDLTMEGIEVFESVSEAHPTNAQCQELLFANCVAKHVKSNAIVLTKGGRVLGVGAGQMSRVDSVRLAVAKAGDEVTGSVLASDAFFPFPDGVEVAMAAGVAAILEPGGSVRDQEIVKACDAAGVPLVFTGARHFRH
ncbi:MAG: bifunctional phosphoribosylaminoimidazolecarboxamide formyltransferase/inosine monophosphate cyclohydrolase [Planctomycetes bacterium]|nr:bifunctional phosphoribosylaminoimidazolecarboxamide formyltransferase/inosine monophosphate cyclohydrolase [Planctomycetota bacterium]